MAESNLYDYVSESAYDTYDRMSAFAIRYEAMNPVSSAIAYRLSAIARAGGRCRAPAVAWRVRTGQLGTRRARCTPLGPCAAHASPDARGTRSLESERASVPRSRRLSCRICQTNAVTGTSTSDLSSPDGMRNVLCTSAREPRAGLAFRFRFVSFGTHT
jgi:hypothetical protein